MIRPTSSIKMLSIVAAACVLAACAGDNERPYSPSSSIGSTSTPLPSPSGEGAPPTAESSAPSDQGSSTQRPQTASFELMTGEGYQPRTAELQQGAGFSLYVFEGFDFDAASGRLSLTAADDYYVDIEQLSADDDLETLRASAEQEFKELGGASDHSGELVEHPLGKAELYLQSSGEFGVKDFIVWESEAGDRYLFRLSNPKGENAPDFAEPAWVSLSTVRGD
ncbi:hypothetical protein [Cohnella cellulosilytica]|uniref:Lipoprotein n=1 Tax=Cohnella cellulosilytica TaxID=986710 RepID=A0ABW2FF34_9BACL